MENFTDSVSGRRSLGLVSGKPKHLWHKELFSNFFQPVIGLSTAIVFTAPCQHISDLSVHVHGPSGDLKHDVKMEQLEKEKFRVSFVPHQSGLHTIELRNQNGEIYDFDFDVITLNGEEDCVPVSEDEEYESISIEQQPSLTFTLSPFKGFFLILTLGCFMDISPPYFKS
ncbi:unnamed protein product [Meloidogyne enterolobii]|uniref:Uncharacterized protein n=1 Tax=Meloidogyne enterolobii TaxID=390850 RepID=A0ACB1AL53_MELEN